MLLLYISLGSESEKKKELTVEIKRFNIFYRVGVYIYLNIHKEYDLKGI